MIDIFGQINADTGTWHAKAVQRFECINWRGGMLQEHEPVLDEFHIDRLHQFFGQQLAHLILLCLRFGGSVQWHISERGHEGNAQMQQIFLSFFGGGSVTLGQVGEPLQLCLVRQHALEERLKQTALFSTRQTKPFGRVLRQLLKYFTRRYQTLLRNQKGLNKLNQAV